MYAVECRISVFSTTKFEILGVFKTASAAEACIAADICAVEEDYRLDDGDMLNFCKAAKWVQYSLHDGSKVERSYSVTEHELT